MPEALLQYELYIHMHGGLMHGFEWTACNSLVWPLVLSLGHTVE